MYQIEDVQILILKQALQYTNLKLGHDGLPSMSFQIHY